MIGGGRGGEKGCKKGRVTIDLLANPNYYNSYKRKLRSSKGELKSMGIGEGGFAFQFVPFPLH